MSPAPSETSKKEIYERQEELRRDIERHVNPLDAAARGTDAAAIELGRAIVRTGTILNGAAIIAIPSLVTFFGIDTKAIILPIVTAGILFAAGLTFSWAAGLSGVFALGSRSHHEHWFARATYLRLYYSYFPLADTDPQKTERVGESATLYKRADDIYRHFKVFRALAIFSSLLSLVMFIAGNAEAGWTILHAPLKPLTSPVERTPPR